MNSSPSPYLKVTRPASIHRGHEQHLFVLDVDTFDRADAVGELEDLWLAERRRGEPAPVLLVDHRRVQALLDRRPDGEARREVVAGDGEVGAVADAEFVDLGEEFVGGVPGEDIRHAGFDADADQRESPGLLPFVGELELLVTEFDARSGRTAQSGAAGTTTSPCRGSRRRRRGPPGTAASRTAGRWRSSGRCTGARSPAPTPRRRRRRRPGPEMNRGSSVEATTSAALAAS